MNRGLPGPFNGGGRIRAKALPLLAVGVVFAVIGAVLLGTASNRTAALVILVLGLGDAAVAGVLLILDATYGKRLRK